MTCGDIYGRYRALTLALALTLTPGLTLTLTLATNQVDARLLEMGVEPRFHGPLRISHPKP